MHLNAKTRVLRKYNFAAVALWRVRWSKSLYVEEIEQSLRRERGEMRKFLNKALVCNQKTYPALPEGNQACPVGDPYRAFYVYIYSMSREKLCLPLLTYV